MTTERRAHGTPLTWTDAVRLACLDALEDEIGDAIMRRLHDTPVTVSVTITRTKQ